MKTASWVIVELDTNRVILETFNPRAVEALNVARYKAVPILEYLESLNVRPSGLIHTQRETET